MRIHSVVFEPEHAASLGPLVEGPLRLSPTELASMAEWPSYTIFADDTPLMCIGGLPVWEGLAELWAFVSPALAQCPMKREAFGQVRYYLAEVARQWGIRRYQSEVKAGWEDGAKFAHVCGLKFEARMESFGRNGEDMDRYIWLAKDNL